MMLIQFKVTEKSSKRTIATGVINSSMTEVMNFFDAWTSKGHFVTTHTISATDPFADLVSRIHNDL